MHRKNGITIFGQSTIMENNGSGITRKLGIAATVVTLVGGSWALWKEVRPQEELPDLSGRWTITNTVTSSSGSRFDGEVYEYSVGVHEDATHELKGDGEQTRYLNATGEEHQPLSRFPIHITSGKNAADRITVHFMIEGSRPFTGTMSLTAHEGEPQRLSGSFEYTAGGTKGRTEVMIKHR